MLTELASCQLASRLHGLRRARPVGPGAVWALFVLSGTENETWCGLLAVKVSEAAKPGTYVCMYVIYDANSRLWEKLRSVPFFLFCP